MLSSKTQIRGGLSLQMRGWASAEILSCQRLAGHGCPPREARVTEMEGRKPGNKRRDSERWDREKGRRDRGVRGDVETERQKEREVGRQGRER